VEVMDIRVVLWGVVQTVVVHLIHVPVAPVVMDVVGVVGGLSIVVMTPATHAERTRVVGDIVGIVVIPIESIGNISILGIYANGILLLPIVPFTRIDRMLVLLTVPLDTRELA